MNNPIIDAAKRFFAALFAMQILRIFGVAVAVHGVAFLLIMASPGCSTKPRPNKDLASSAPASNPNSAESAQSNPFVSAPVTGSSVASSPGISFDPNAVAGGPRLSPVRPNTAESNAIAHEASASSAPVPVAEKTIKVGKGDSLWTLAKKYGIPVSELAEANKLKTGATLHVGQSLVVPVKGGAVSAAKSDRTASDSSKAATKTPAAAASTESTHKASAPANLPAGTIRHTVKPGESLGSIAKKYGVKAGEIGVANNITDPKTLRPGRELIIPGAAKVGKASSSDNAAPAKSEAAAPVANSAAAEASQGTAPAPVFQFGDSGSAPAASDASKPSANAPVPVIKIEEDNSSTAGK